MSFNRVRQGYTIIELMMGLAVLGVGVTGIIAMQKVTVSSNQHAKNLNLAAHIAQAWQEQLAADAVAWNHPSVKNPGLDDLGNTAWLKLVSSSPNAWVQPAYDGTLLFGPGFDALGNPVSDLNSAVFCTHLRLSWLFPADKPVVGNGLLRTEVRVFWRRDGVKDTAKLCDPSASADALGKDVNTYHFVYKASAVRQNSPI
jgi:prepilin-type N-terminal cleavage/methylation domain-containing protein